MAAVAAIAGEDQNDLDTVCRKFKEYVIFARYCFYNRVQAAHESVDSFVTDVKLLAKDCGFPADIVDEMIRDRLTCLWHEPSGNVAASAVKRTTSQHSTVRREYIP